MAQSIKLGNDTYLDSSGVVVDSNGTTLKTRLSDGGAELLVQNSIPSTATSYSCAWSSYRFLIFAATHYGNILETTVVPVTPWAFSSSTSGRNVRVTNDSSTYSIWQNGTSAIYVSASGSYVNNAVYYLRVYGVP